jgi:hypothetical protein
MAKKDTEEVIKSFAKTIPVVPIETVTASTVDVTTAEDKARAEAEKYYFEPILAKYGKEKDHATRRPEETSYQG